MKHSKFLPVKRKDRYDFIVDFFSAHFPEPQTELHYTNAYELTVAVVLSAQCTDKRVNLVTPTFFARYRDFADLAQASDQDVLALIASISYPRNKAKHLVGLARMVQERFGGNLPQRVDDLMSLPGVGRKTANVLSSVLFEQPNMAVDTHVFRVAHRVGLVSKSAQTPYQVEQQLVRYFPVHLIRHAHHWLILHGRYTCKARKPSCQSCGLQSVCAYYRRLPAGRE